MYIHDKYERIIIPRALAVEVATSRTRLCTGTALGQRSIDCPSINPKNFDVGSLTLNMNP